MMLSEVLRDKKYIYPQVTMYIQLMVFTIKLKSTFDLKLFLKKKDKIICSNIMRMTISIAFAILKLKHVVVSHIFFLLVEQVFICFGSLSGADSR